jgi:hypothetical protein
MNEQDQPATKRDLRDLERNLKTFILERVKPVTTTQAGPQERDPGVSRLVGDDTAVRETTA